METMYLGKLPMETARKFFPRRPALHSHTCRCKLGTHAWTHEADNCPLVECAECPDSLRAVGGRFPIRPAEGEPFPAPVGAS